MSPLFYATELLRAPSLMKRSKTHEDVLPGSFPTSDAPPYEPPSQVPFPLQDNKQEDDEMLQQALRLSEQEQAEQREEVSAVLFRSAGRQRTGHANVLICLFLRSESFKRPYRRADRQTPLGKASSRSGPTPSTMKISNVPSSFLLPSLPHLRVSSLTTCLMKNSSSLPGTSNTVQACLTQSIHLPSLSSVSRPSKLLSLRPQEDAHQTCLQTPRLCLTSNVNQTPSPRISVSGWAMTISVPLKTSRATSTT